VARFEAATLAGIGVGVVAAGPLYELMGRNAFLLNALVYIGSLLIYRFGVDELRPPGGDEVSGDLRGHFSFGRYAGLMRNRQVWLLAPTWIALNAVLGAWTTQSVFQLVREPSDQFAAQLLMGGFSPVQVSVGLGVAGLIFFAGLFYWGGRFKRYRRTTIIGVGLAGAFVMMAAVFVLNHSADWGSLVQLALALVAAGGLFVLAGATPAALGLLADISESHPEDRGAIMGLYSVFLGVGQVVGAVASGTAADWLGIDGLLAASVVLLLIAIMPIQRLRASEHLVGARAARGVPTPA
jgi:MFS family permease